MSKVYCDHRFHTNGTYKVNIYIYTQSHPHNFTQTRYGVLKHNIFG